MSPLRAAAVADVSGRGTLLGARGLYVPWESWAARLVYCRIDREGAAGVSAGVIGQEPSPLAWDPAIEDRVQQATVGVLHELLIGIMAIAEVADRHRERPQSPRVRVADQIGVEERRIIVPRVVGGV